VTFAPSALALVALFLASTSCGHAPHNRYDDAIKVVRLDPSTSVVVKDGDAQQMLATLNSERVSHGLDPLVLDNKLSEIAKSHAEDMAQRNYFGHVSPEGLDPFARMTRAHYRYGYAGENLALDEDPAAASQALWTSSEHRSNILEPHFTHIGIAAVSATDGEIFVEDFAD
jgi:uncharacterized protein YkwD